jgi:uncharacterized membrane protein
VEGTFGRFLFASVVAASASLIAGLAAWLGGFEAAGAVLMHVGLVILMATPAVRVLLSIVEYARERDWAFAATAGVVLAILVASVFYASRS